MRGRAGVLVFASAIAAALAVALSVAGCSGAKGGVPEKRAELLRETAADVAAILEGALARAREAVAAAGPAIASAGTDRARQFAALEAVRRRTRVDGLTWNDPGGTFVWAGDPVEPKPTPAPPPWDRSFSSGDATFHAGPFLRALVVSSRGGRAPGTDGGGRSGDAEATVVLGPRAPGQGEKTIEKAWARRHRVESVRIVPPEATGASPDPSVLRMGIRGPGAKEDTLAVEIRAGGDEVLEDLVQEDASRSAGLAWLAGLVLATALAAFALARSVTLPGARWGGIAALALLFRASLRLLEIPERFPELGPGWNASDFGIGGFGGWLASPGEFLLTAAALLVAAVALARAASGLVRPSGAAARDATAIAGVLVAGLAGRLWLFLVDVAAVHSHLDYFFAGTLVPSVPRALMLSGLAAATAASWLLARAGIWASATAIASPTARGSATLARCLAGAAAGCLAWVLTPTAMPEWAAFLVPATAAALGRIGTGDVRPGAPTRILLTAVLAAALLFPVLWVRAGEASRHGVQPYVSLLVSREDSVASRLVIDMSSLADDPHVVRSLRDVAIGRPAPDGLALYAWQRLGFGSPPDDGSVTVLDGGDKFVDRFSLNTPPPDRLPPGLPTEEDEGDAPNVVAGVEAPGKVRSTVGRVRIASEGKRVGTIVVTVPDLLSVELAGLRPPIAARDEEAGEERREEPLALTLVRDGRVVASSDPAAPRSIPGLPREASALAEPAWLRVEGFAGGDDVLAYPVGDRGVLLAARPRAGFQVVMFALARTAVVGVGLGAGLALIVLLAGTRSFRPRLQHKILWSYFAISVVPLVFLGQASWGYAIARHEDRFRERHDALTRAAREDVEPLGDKLFDIATDANVAFWAEQRKQDFTLYRRGVAWGSSLRGLVQAELLPERLPAEAYLATEVEGRTFFAREESFAGRRVQVGYAAVRDDAGTPVATVSVPLLDETARAEREAGEIGSVLLAAYLLTLVLVVVIGIYTARSLARPLDELARGTKRVAAGETDVVIPGAGKDELGSLVTAFNRMTQDLKDVRARAAKAEREAAWRGMARQVAHEIKNPLTPMKLLLQQLLATREKDPALAAEMVEPLARTVLEQVETLRRIAGDFSAFARFPPRTLRDVDVNRVLASVAALYAAGPDAQAAVSTRLAEDLPPVRWDEDELRRVFVNLVANAVQALDEAKGRVRVEVTSRRGKGPDGRDGIVVVVEDDGVGIPDENRPRLFEPDFSTKSAGTGLGLAIVKRVLTDLGGDVRVDSEVGVGTRVTVWMPPSSGEQGAAPAAGPL